MNILPFALGGEARRAVRAAGVRARPSRWKNCGVRPQFYAARARPCAAGNARGGSSFEESERLYSRLNEKFKDFSNILRFCLGLDKLWLGLSR